MGTEELSKTCCCYNVNLISNFISEEIKKYYKTYASCYSHMSGYAACIILDLIINIYCIS
jgi:hypothetical protein